MKIVTWNVNSIRTRKLLVLDWVRENKPDVLLLQETKCLDESFPREEFEDLGYNIAIHGQKTFNGVAILSLHPIDDVTTDLPNTPLPEHARYIEGVISFASGAIRVASVYVPNGDNLESDKFQAKLKFYDALHGHLVELLALEEALVVGGDFNVAPEEIDTYSVDDTIDTVLFDIQARKKLRALLALGMYDAYRMINPNEQQFSWWDYRRGAWNKNQGLRIDHLFLSPEAADILKESNMDHKMRDKDTPSDHVPVACELSV